MHKSQGQTLERVKVDLGRIFEKGQGEKQTTQCDTQFNNYLAYVALSRATSMQTLEVLNFQPRKLVIAYSTATYTNMTLFRVMAHQRVLAWHREFEQDGMHYNDHNLGDEMDNDEAMMSYYDS